MSVTGVPVLNGAVQVVPQLIPAGLLVTVPEPLPASATDKSAVPWTGLKVAVTFSLALTVTTQVGLPLQLLVPVQPANIELTPAVAVSVTEVPGLKGALQVCPQLMPDGLLVTLPWPVPLKLTVSTGEVLKLAMTEVFCVTVN